MAKKLDFISIVATPQETLEHFLTVAKSPEETVKDHWPQ